MPNAADGSISFISAENEGPRIINTNYWESASAEAGVFVASWNAGAVRLLVPPMHQRVLEDMESARAVLITIGRWAGEEGGIELM